MSKTSSGRGPTEAFRSGEGLRTLLLRLRTGGPGIWSRDPEARALLEYTRTRYERLCRKWGRDPGEGVAAAFVAMQDDYLLGADDPWAVLTITVRAAMIAENQAERLLISPERAQKEDVTDLVRPVQAGEYEDYLYSIAAPEPAAGSSGSPLLSLVQTTSARFFACLGWELDVSLAAVEYVLARLMTALDADRAYQYLRRDTTGPAQLDIPAESWRALVRVLVGTPGSPGLPGRRGVIARIVLELERGLAPRAIIEELLRDDALIIEVFEHRPRRS